MGKTERLIKTETKDAFCETCNQVREHLVHEYSNYWLYWCYLNCGAAFKIKKQS